MAAPEAATASHVDRVPAEARGRALPRQDARALDSLGAFVIVDPRSAPRLWRRTTEAVLNGFEEALRSPESPDDTGLRLLRAVEGARHGLATFCRTLVERTPPDAHLVAFLLDGERVVGTVVGSGRLYQHRRGRTERLSPRELPPEGLLRARVQAFPADAPPGTILFAGTESAFSARAIERSAELFEQSRHVGEDALARILTNPAEQAGTGAAVVVLSRD